MNTRFWVHADAIRRLGLCLALDAGRAPKGSDVASAQIEVVYNGRELRQVRTRVSESP